MLIGVYLMNSNSVQLLKSSMSQSSWKKSRLLSKTCIRLKRSPGPDGILPEVHVYGGRTPISFLLTIFNLFWISAKLRSDLINAIICILFKKVDRSDCGNYRGISLLSVVGKIFADIVLQGLKRLAELVYPLSVRLQRRQRHN